MAEELGHIDIRFPGVVGGGAGDTTGPLPSKMKLPDMGGMVGGIVKAAMSSFAGLAAFALSNIGNAIASTMDFVHDKIASIQESGKFAPEVIKENVAMKLQDLQNQFQEAKLLGPLYGTILKWYRELMQMIQPWKVLFSTIASAVVGIILTILKSVMGLINSGFTSILSATETILDAVISSLAWLADALSFAEMAKNLRELNDSTMKSLKSLREIANNTEKSLEGRLDWAGAQLRELASRSHLYNSGPENHRFYNPSGSKYPNPA